MACAKLQPDLIIIFVHNSNTYFDEIWIMSSWFDSEMSLWPQDYIYMTQGVFGHGDKNPDARS